MKPGDVVMVKQLDHGFLHTDAAMAQGQPPSEDAKPMTMWIYALVLEVLPGPGNLPAGALMEITHPGNIEHGSRKTVRRSDIRTVEDIQALHDGHPERAQQKLDFNRLDHKELNNYRVALQRMKPQEVQQ